MMMLAQITNAVSGGAGLPDPHSLASIGWMVIMAAGALHMARTGVGFWRDVKNPANQVQITNSSLEMRMASEFATVESVKAVQQRMDEMDRVASIHRKTMYDKLENTRKELTAKIDTMPAQIVTQLLSTKQLWREK